MLPFDYITYLHRIASFQYDTRPNFIISIPLQLNLSIIISSVPYIHTYIHTHLSIYILFPIYIYIYLYIYISLYHYTVVYYGKMTISCTQDVVTRNQTLSIYKDPLISPFFLIFFNFFGANFRYQKLCC